MTDSASPPLSVRLRRRCDRWLEDGLPWLVRERELGAFKFAEAPEIVRDVVDVAQLLSRVSLDRVPPRFLVDIDNAWGVLEGATRPLESIQLQELADPSRGVGERRRSLLERLTTAVAKFREQTTGAYAVLATLHAVLGESLSVAETARIAASLQERERYYTELAARLEKPSASRVQSDQAAGFSGRAEEYRSQAVLWLVGGTIVVLAFAVSTVAIVFSTSLIPPLDTTSAATVLAGMLPRLLWFGALGSVGAWLFRQYSIRMHLATVSEHRASSMNTVTLLLGAAGDNPDAKTAVILRAAEAVFASHPTGFSSLESSPVVASGLDLIKPLKSV